MTNTSTCLAAAAVSLVMGATAVAQSPHHDDHADARVVVSDGSRGRLSVADISTGRLLARINLPAKDGAYLTPVPDGRHVVAVQYDGGTVRVLDAGIARVPHGDHTHVRATRPKLTPFRFDVAHPTHVVFHGDHLAIFADSRGTATLFGARDVTRAAAPRAEISSGVPHHGVAVPFGAVTLMSTATADPKESEPLANDVMVKSGDTELSRLGACPDLHGEAAGRSWAVFACADGVLLASVGATGATAHKVPYPAGATPEQRVWGFSHDGEGRFLLGDLDAGLVVFDRTTGAMTPVRLPSRRAIYRSPLVGSRAYTLTENGKVHRIAVPSGTIAASVKVVAPYDWRKSKGPTPEVIATDDHVLVSEPKKHRVHVLHSRTLTTQRIITIPGAPTKMWLADGMADHH